MTGGAFDDDLDQLASRLRRADGAAAVLSGAGVSVSSDIPAFRGQDGLWQRYDPLEYAHIDAFRDRPEDVWRMLRELDAVLAAAEPNDAHRAIARLEQLGLLAAVITQNVDRLHQEAGSERVIELHGSRGSLTCLGCATTVGREAVEADVEAGRVPRCDGCGGLLKPDVTFFGEELPAGSMEAAEAVVRGASLLLVVGTSAEVYPAAGLPDLARAVGAEVWEVNPEPADPVARGIPLSAEDALPRLVDRLET